MSKDNKNIIEKFNLPSYVKGKSFAEASKTIKNKFKDRNDQVSKDTMYALLDRLKQAQEYTKAQMQPEPQPQPDNKFFMGGAMGTMGTAMQANPLSNLPNQSMMNGNMMGSMASAVGAMFPSQVGSQYNSDATNQQLQTFETAKDAASNFIPLGGVFRSAEKAGKGIGKAIGGEKGQDVATGIVDPFTSQLEILGNKDATLGQKLVGSVPVVGGIVNSGLKNDIRKEREYNQDLATNSNYRQSDFANGGWLNNNPVSTIKPDDAYELNQGIHYFGLPHINTEDLKFQNTRRVAMPVDNTINTDPASFNLPKLNISLIDDNSQVYKNGPISNPSFNITNDNNRFSLNTYKPEGEKINDDTQLYQDKPKAVPVNTVTSNSANYQPTDVNPTGIPNYNKTRFKFPGIPTKFLGNASTDVMRFAPAIMSLKQLNDLEKPEYERLNRLDNRYQKQYVDEAALENQVEQQARTTARALENASGGDAGALRSNLLANSINSNNALSKAMLNAEMQNNRENSVAQNFNANIDRANLQQSNLENDINARNEGAYETNKSALLAALGQNIGAIGTENHRSKAIKEMFDYDKFGNYLNSKDPSYMKQFMNYLRQLESDRRSK